MKELTNLRGKTALITGASKGIGKAIARLLASQGAEVIVSSRKQEAVDAVVAEIQEQGGKAKAFAANVGRAEDREALINYCRAQHDALHILVNNAATNPVFAPLEEVEAEAFDKIMEVNVKAAFELAKHALELMKAAKGASIINIGSVEGTRPSEGLGIYCVSKAALLMLSKTMAREWGKYGIRANTLSPGLIKTKFSQALWANEKIYQQLMRHIPLGRIGVPEEIAGLTLFLASDAGAYTTGSEFVIDGGFLV